ncbi:hypothetical protein NXS19_004858 [Fusarium pseudograminearum]|nr:hypothetical protein NXS19_004858 [Fusarium pseudograminearum]
MSWTNLFEKLLDVYEEIADALDNLVFFHGLITGDGELKSKLEDYFSDILNFHRLVLNYFAKSGWKHKFLWVWSEFRRDVNPIIDSLKRKQAALSIENLRSRAILKGVQDSDVYAKDQFGQIHSGLNNILTSELQRDNELQEQQMKSSLGRKLNTSLSQIARQLELPATVLESCGSWIFSSPVFKSWKDDVQSQGCVLYLNGCPGAGKSTLTRIIIRRLNEERCQHSSSQYSLVHFFFKHNDAERRSVRSMLCYLITQIINTDAAMMRYAYEKCSPVDYLDLSFLKSLALECLLSQRSVMIVLDGLDECMENEPEHALKWCLYELLRMAPSKGCHIRLLICGQEDGRIERLLCSYPQIRLHKEDLHQKDIGEYTKLQASVIGTRFRLSIDDEMDLIAKVTKAADGMFLYAKVVLANLESMGSEAEFEDELNGNEFPHDLDEAYGRILHRVVTAATSSAQTSAKKIFKWVVCSKRPLRWREIQSRFCIDAETGVCNPRNLRVDSCKKLCSSLVETTDCELFPGVDSEMNITMIHETAIKYLVQTNVVNIMEEHVAMSLFCCRYLLSKPFLVVERDEIDQVVQSGYFGFMDYAAVYYRSHIQEVTCSAATGSVINISAANESLLDLEKTYWENAPDNAPGSNVVEEHSDESTKILVQAIQDRVLQIRNIIDKHWDILSCGKYVKQLYGKRRYKCPRVQCLKFCVGYPCDADIQQHLTSHERPFKCRYETCFAYVVGYVSQHELQCHSQTFHYDDSICKITFHNGNKTTKMDFINACRDGDLARVKRLHSLGTDLQCLSFQTSPFQVAFEAGHGHICKYFIENGVNPFEKPTVAKGTALSPVHLAIKHEKIHMLELFLCDYPDVTSDLNRPHLARCILQILHGYKPGLDSLLRLSDLKQPTERLTLLRSAVVEQLKYLFEDWGEEMITPTHAPSASLYSNDAIHYHMRFRRLFPKLYDQNGIFSPNPSYTEYKIYQETLEHYNLLLLNALSRRLYSFCCFLMDIDTYNLLQDDRQRWSESALHVFIYWYSGMDSKDCLAMTQRLIKLCGGRSASRPNNKGELPLHLALFGHFPAEALRALLKCPQDLNYKNKVGRSPLHYVQSEESMVILLENKEVDVFSRNQNGQTYFVAFCNGGRDFNEGTVQVLLKTDISLAWTADESAQRLTPLHYALDLDTPKGRRPSCAARFLLSLPEVEQVLQSYLISLVKDCEEVRNFAREHDLEHALEVMERIGFGSPSVH